jgi:hypothetical protein
MGLTTLETRIRETHEDATARALRLQRGILALRTIAGRPDLVAEALAGDLLPWLQANADALVTYHRRLNGLYAELARERRVDWQPALLERGVYA